MSEWFDRPDSRGQGPGSGPGLRFTCTMCGNCCTGPEGYVQFTPGEGERIAHHLGISTRDFLDRFTHETEVGRSLQEIPTEHGLDCVFLDRATMPGRAVCGIYEQRPAQCRTWPFWASNLSGPRAWVRVGRTCPGINRGQLVPPEQIRILRDRVQM